MGLTCCRWCLATICYCSLLLSGMSCAAIAIQLLILLRVRVFHLVNINYNPLHLQTRSRDRSFRPMAQPNQAAIPTPASSSDQASSTRNNRPSPLQRSNTHTASSSAISSTINSPSHTPRKDASHSPAVSHRSSYAEFNTRNYPPSPRATRQPSF